MRRQCGHDWVWLTLPLAAVCSRRAAMTRIGLAVLVVLLLAAGCSEVQAVGTSCGFSGGPCCLPPDPSCDPGLVCDSNNFSGCSPCLIWPGGAEGGAAACLTWLGGGHGGAAEVVCPGTCVQPTATPTSTATPTVTPTPTATSTSTATPTPTVTPTPHNLMNNDLCNDSRQCTSALCNGGVCAERNPAPAVSSHTAVFIGAALLLAGLWSVQHVARRR